MNIKVFIGDTYLNCKIIFIDNDNCIITYVEDYNILLDDYLIYIFRQINLNYLMGYLSYGNVSGHNAQFICKNTNILKSEISGLTLDKIVKLRINANENAIDLDNDDKIKSIKTIKLVYGAIGQTIGATFHELPYLTISIDGTKYYIAIETTIESPYKLQFYVGNNEEKLKDIIKTRYQNDIENIEIIDNCDQEWYKNEYDGGKTKKTKTSKMKTKTTKKRRQ